MSEESSTQAQPEQPAKALELERQNELLRERLKELEATELYLEARKKLIQFVTIGVIVLTAFGIISIKSLTSTIRDQIQAKGTEAITAEVKAELVRSYRADIEQQVAAQLSEAVSNEIQMELLSLAKEAIVQAEENTKPDFAETVVRSYKDRLFYVVLSSSPDVPALRRLGHDYKERIGTKLRDQELDLWICESSSNPNWGLALGPPMSLEFVRTLIESAGDLGIPQQAYPGRASRLNCEKLEASDVHADNEMAENTQLQRTAGAAAE